jgi:uncharacterized membrane protein YjfL (UPF0719 family)
MDFTDFLNGLAAGLLYGLVGLALLAFGFLVIDLLTPGNLGRLICDDRNRGAGLVTGAGLLAVGGIVTTSIATSSGSLGQGLAETAAYGVLGVLLLGLAYVIVDVITPGRLGDAVMGEGDQPAAVMTAAALLSVGGIVAAAIA